MEDKPPVPHAKVAQIAENIRELLELKNRQAAAMAKMIRECVATLRTAPGECAKARRAFTQLERSVAIREHKTDQAKAFLYLECLATQLEDQSVSPADKTEGPDHVSRDQY